MIDRFYDHNIIISQFFIKFKRFFINLKTGFFFKFLIIKKRFFLIIFNI